MKTERNEKNAKEVATASAGVVWAFLFGLLILAVVIGGGIVIPLDARLPPANFYGLFGLGAPLALLLVLRALQAWFMASIEKGALSVLVRAIPPRGD